MQSIFKRYENKYLVSKEQFFTIMEELPRYMTPDRYGEYLIQNLYYDTEGWDVIRASIEKPSFKEKLRLRCYGEINQARMLFLELKKKYNGVVYKRRLPIPVNTDAGETVRDTVLNGISGAISCGSSNAVKTGIPYAVSSSIPNALITGISGAISYSNAQIAREIRYYLMSQAVFERVYISHKRKAFVGKEDVNLRVTFDTDVRFRPDNLQFNSPGDGRAILPPDVILMEIKTPGGMPVWLARVLSYNGIFPEAFSKFGACYAGYIKPEPAPERSAQVSA